MSSILLRPHPTDVNAPLLPATSPIRSQVEQTRLELLKWIGKRWLGIRQERAFDPLEGWALKEISDRASSFPEYFPLGLSYIFFTLDIEVPIEDLLNPPQAVKNHSPKRPGTTTSLLRPASHHPHTSKVDVESDVASSMRVSVLSRSMRQNSSSTTTTTTKDRDNGLASSASSVRSVVRSSSESYASAMSGNTVGGSRLNGGMSAAKMIVKETRVGGSKEKLTPSAPIPEPEDGDEGMEQEEEEEEQEEEEYDDESRNGDEPEPTATPQLIKKVLITRASLASVTSRSTMSSLAGSGSGSSVSVRPLSSASSVRSQSTIRRSVGSSVGSSRLNVSPSTKSPVSPRSTARPHRISTTSTTARPTSSISSTTDSTATYRTAPNHRSRRTSGASVVSVRTLNGGGSTKPNSPVERTRRMSGASISSVTSNAGSVKSLRVRTPSTGRKPVGGGSGGATSPLPAVDRKRLSPNVPRPGSIHSSKSGGSSSTASNSTSRKVVRKVVLKKKKSGDDDVDDEQGSSPSPSAEVPVKEPEVEVEQKGVEEEKEEKMDVEADKEDVKKDEDDDGGKIEDVIVEDPPLPNTSSTTTVKRPSMDPIPPVTATTSMGSDHKKSSSSTSTASVVTLKRKGSSDTIKTVKSSPPVPIIVDAPLTKTSSDAVKPAPIVDAKQLPPTPPSSHPTPPLQHQSSTLQLPTGVVDENRVIIPQGITLDIGIPCIIASKRKRFKAYARYIGEVEGETGAWVGVEVPIPFGDNSSSWTSSDRSGDKVNYQGGDDRQWNDGSWGGVRYFEIGGTGGSEWGDYGSANEDRALRRRRMDGGLSMGGGGGSTIWSNGSNGGKGDKGVLKREGDQLSIASASEMRRKKFRSVSPTVSDMSGVETRGLFVRPQQVLYVVDAVGVDL